MNNQPCRAELIVEDEAIADRQVSIKAALLPTLLPAVLHCRHTGGALGIFF